MRISLLALCLFVMGCETPWAAKTPYDPGVHEWKDGPRWFGNDAKINGWEGVHDNWVCKASGRTDDGEVSRAFLDGKYNVYVRGAAYGNFETLEQAKAQAEKIYRLKELNCP